MNHAQSCIPCRTFIEEIIILPSHLESLLITPNTASECVALLLRIWQCPEFKPRLSYLKLRVAETPAVTSFLLVSSQSDIAHPVVCVCVCVCIYIYIHTYIHTYIPTNRGAQITGAMSWRPNFVPWHLIIVGTQYRTCFVSPSWRLQFGCGFYVFRKSVHSFLPIIDRLTLHFFFFFTINSQLHFGAVVSHPQCVYSCVKKGCEIVYIILKSGYQFLSQLLCSYIILQYKKRTLKT